MDTIKYAVAYFETNQNACQNKAFLDTELCVALMRALSINFSRGCNHYLMHHSTDCLTKTLQIYKRLFTLSLSRWKCCQKGLIYENIFATLCYKVNRIGEIV
ncbi:hypothetical protein CEXT_34831 [Caerostris extrusa]|uniref:Uncharacterized protein n=1 Tax=Caerostris extrusa TaxID=172846 RepID=A0AAV4Y5W6_CAEEX|nr:hypothetical protein CEXT_34831 [Caerostris extrusa]